MDWYSYAFDSIFAREVRFAPWTQIVHSYTNLVRGDTSLIYLTLSVRGQSFPVLVSLPVTGLCLSILATVFAASNASIRFAGGRKK